MKVAVPLVKNILAPLGITAAASAIDTGIQKEIHGSGCPSSTKLMISNRKMNDIMKIVQALQDANILLKRVNKTIKMKQKKKRGFLSIFLDTLGASLFGNLLTGKGIVRAGSGRRSLNSSTSYVNKEVKGFVRVGCCKEWDFSCHLTL